MPSNQEADAIPIDEAGPVTLPVVEILTGRGFLTGKSGAGKSNSASVIIEELLDRGYPVLIVDTDGEYWGLKEDYEILHVGADEECDLQVSREHAGKIAELALEDNVPIILDVSGYLEDEEANALVRDTAQELFHREKKLQKPFLMLVEEIHEYIPEQGGTGEVGDMLVKIGKRGRKRGLGLAGMSQRPADVKKDFITQCDWLLWHRLTWKNDTDVVRQVVGSEYADAVQDLNDGEGFLMADFLDADVTAVQVRRKHTFDAGKTPDLSDVERPDLKNVSGDLVDELEDISEREERRQDRIGRLEDRIEELEAEKEALEDELETASEMEEMASQFTEAMLAAADNGDSDTDTPTEKVDELIAERNELQSEVGEKQARIEELEATVDELESELNDRPDITERAHEAVEILAEEFEVGGDDADALRRKLKAARETNEELEAKVEQLQSESNGPAIEPDEYDDFVEDEAVQAAIAEAKASDATPRYVQGTITSILLRGGPASRSEIADDLDINTLHHVGKAMHELEDCGVVVCEGSGDDETADFNFEGIDDLHEWHARKQRAEAKQADLEEL